MERPSTRAGEGGSKVGSDPALSAKLIIQCPNCQTRFSVAKAAVAGLDSLRFHCSKCDNVFSKSVSELPPLTSKPADEDRAILTPQKVAQEIIKEVVPSNNQPSVPVTQPSTPLQKIEKPIERTEPLTFSKPLSSPAFSNPAPQFGESKHIDRSVTEPKAALMPPIEPPPLAAKSGEAKSSFDAKPIPRFEEDTYQTSFKFSDQKSPTAIDPDRATGKRLGLEAAPQLGSAPKGDAKPVRSWSDDFGINDDWQLGDQYILTKHAGFSGFTMLVAPLVGFLILLGGVGFYLGSNPQFTQEILSAAIPSLPMVPPDGLHIEKASFETIKLENGEEVRLVSGRITNSTLQAFEDVKIEAHAFDKSGNIIDRATVGSGNSLAETRVKSLSKEMISELQSEQGRDRSVLRPGESREFSVALLDRTISKAAFFSARIYSVRQNQL